MNNITVEITKLPIKHSLNNIIRQSSKLDSTFKIYNQPFYKKYWILLLTLCIILVIEFKIL